MVKIIDTQDTADGIGVTVSNTSDDRERVRIVTEDGTVYGPIWLPSDSRSQTGLSGVSGDASVGVVPERLFDRVLPGKGQGRFSIPPSVLDPLPLSFTGSGGGGSDPDRGGMDPGDPSGGDGIDTPSVPDVAGVGGLALLALLGVVLALWS